MARNGGDVRAPQMKDFQAERVDFLAVLLSALLRRWVEGDKDGFLVRRASAATSPPRLALISIAELNCLEMNSYEFHRTCCKLYAYDAVYFHRWGCISQALYYNLANAIKMNGGICRR